MKILIVDDNESVRRLVASIVRPVAEEVRECAGGRGAVEPTDRKDRMSCSWIFT